MTTLELLQKDYDDLMNASLSGGLTETDVALAKALEEEITFWKNNSKSYLVESFAKENNQNVINLNVRKILRAKDIIDLPFSKASKK